jgi:hypothetical protein
MARGIKATRSSAKRVHPLFGQTRPPRGHPGSAKQGHLSSAK